MRITTAVSLVTGVLLSVSVSISGLAGPPSQPAIVEPEVDGQIVNPADVHMVTGPYDDPDADAHRCSHWEIWSVEPSERAWVSACIGGPERVHIHLGDGQFEGSHAGRAELFFDSEYRLRVRFQDSAGEWSPWAERRFATSSPSALHPLLLEDVAEEPPPRWIHSRDTAVILPPANPPPSLRLEGPRGELLLKVEAEDGIRNVLTNPPALSDHVETRVRLAAGGAVLALPASDLSFIDDERNSHAIYLPAAGLEAGEELVLWVSASGSTYFGEAQETAPDFSRLARGAPVAWLVRQAGFTVEVVAKGFRLPVNIAFVPQPGDGPDDPSFYVTELYGTIKVVTRDGSVRDYKRNLLNFEPSGVFPGSGEQGLTGIVVEPETGDVFASLVHKPDPGGQTVHARVVRYHSENGGLNAAQETVVREFRAPQAPSHQISNLSIGPDGKLYVHMGDGENPNAVQDVDSFLGKILRLNLDGSPPGNNPFFDGADRVGPRDFVYAYGFRNPFGGAWRAADGFLYEVENGPAVDRFARVVPGRNYLYDSTNESMENFAIHNWSPAVGPVNIAFIQPETFGGSGFPEGKQDHAFISLSGPTYASGPQFNGKRIVELALDGEGNLVGEPLPLVEYNGSGKATAVALAAGPDGLYFSDLYKDFGEAAVEPGSNILRVRFLGTQELVPGLQGEYFDAIDLSERRVVRTDRVVDFDWGQGSPDPLVGPDTFSVRWTGEVEPLHSETYTFFATSDDGVRLWVNEDLVIDDWNDHPVEEHSGSIALEASRKVPIRLEYYENGGDAVASLAWQSPSQEREIVPESRLSSPVTQTPFRGSPHPVPGAIEAEDFDSAGEGISYHDADPENRGGRYRTTGVDLEPSQDGDEGFNVGWTAPGEWLEYTVEVKTAGLYTIEVRVASDGQGGTFHVELEGVDVTGPLAVPDTGGWQNWTTLRVDNLSLRAGVRVMRIAEDAAGPNGNVGNINWVRIDRTGGGLQRPGDCNQDSNLNISDPVCLLLYFFTARVRELPCEGGTHEDPPNMELMDANADGMVGMADAVHILLYLFRGGAPPAGGLECVPIVGCGDGCR